MHDAWMMLRCAVIIEMIRVPSRHLIRADLINQLGARSWAGRGECVLLYICL